MPKTTEVTAKDSASGNSCTVTVNCFGETLDEDRKQVGDEIIKSNYESSAIITLQGNIRRRLKAGESCDAIQAALKDWKPGQVARRGVDVISGFKKWFASLSPEERKKELEKLRSM